MKKLRLPVAHPLDTAGYQPSLLDHEVVWLQKQLEFKAEQICSLLPKDQAEDYPYTFDKVGQFLPHAFFKDIFEDTLIMFLSQEFAFYLFSRYLGIDKWQRPIIIVKDMQHNVVDMFMYANNMVQRVETARRFQELAPRQYLYAYQYEAEQIIESRKVVFVGDGGILASFLSLVSRQPYIDASSNTAEIVKYLNGLCLKGIKVVGTFEGNETGRQAFNELSEKLDFPIDNFFAFDSGRSYFDEIGRIVCT